MPRKLIVTSLLCNGTIRCTFSSHRLVHNKFTRCCTIAKGQHNVSVTQSHNFTSYVHFINFVHLVPMNAQSWVPGSILTFAPNRCRLKSLWRTAFHWWTLTELSNNFSSTCPGYQYHNGNQTNLIGSTWHFNFCTRDFSLLHWKCIEIYAGWNYCGAQHFIGEHTTEFSNNFSSKCPRLQYHKENQTNLIGSTWHFTHFCTCASTWQTFSIVDFKPMQAVFQDFTHSLI